MKSNFLGEGCDVFMNEIEIRTEGNLKVRGLKDFQVLNKKMMIVL
jgi:hypothetical protein